MQHLCANRWFENVETYNTARWLKFSDTSLYGGLVLAVLLDLCVCISSGLFIWPFINDMSSLTFHMLIFPSKPWLTMAPVAPSLERFDDISARVLSGE